MDYLITWSYLVSRMESKYGFAPDNEEKMSFGELEKYLRSIWAEFFEIKHGEEKKLKDE